MLIITWVVLAVSISMDVYAYALSRRARAMLAEVEALQKGARQR